MPCPYTLPGFLQLHLERVAVYTAVVAVEDRRHIWVPYVMERVARHDPEGERLVPAAVELARVGLGEDQVGRLEGAAVLERLPLPLLPKDLPDQAASARTARRTQSVSPR